MNMGWFWVIVDLAYAASSFFFVDYWGVATKKCID